VVGEQHSGAAEPEWNDQGKAAGCIRAALRQSAPNSAQQNPHLKVRVFPCSAALLFGLAASAALLHRYWSADSMACQLELLRLELAKREDPSCERRVTAMRNERNDMFAKARRSIFLAPAFLALAGLAFVTAIASVLLSAR
jgi:hypothetical protein